MQIVMSNIPRNITTALALNYSKLSNSCLINFAVLHQDTQVPIHRRDRHPVQLRHQLLRQSDVLVFIAQLDGIIFCAGRCNKREVLGSRGSHDRAWH